MVPAPSKPAAPKGSSHLVIPTGPPPEVVNREALERRAGRDASKLLLRSTPSPAQAWVNGAFVGDTPMLLILPPGKYQVEVRGPRLEPARQTLALLPRETREIALRMVVRYPTNVSIR
jgi:PEGA domain